MADLRVTTIRATLRALPAPLRERLAAKLFVTTFDHSEPERERLVRIQGEPVQVGICEATAFGPVEGPVALLMHGWEGRGLQLAAWIDPLVGAGYRVIAIDGQAHGRTKAGLPGFAPFAETLQAGIQTMKVRIIIGHSAGAAAAVLAAYRENFSGRVLLLGGPPEINEVFRRAREFMRLPDSGKDRFLSYLAKRYEGIKFDDVWDLAARAQEWSGQLMGILATGDDEIPADESAAIIEAGGGKVVRLDDATHRSVMWHPDALDAGLDFLLSD